MMTNIEKNVAIPAKRRGDVKPKPRKYPIHPFATMDVGDSYVVGKYSPEGMIAISNAARNWALKRGNGWRFSARKIDKKLRIWRIK